MEVDRETCEHVDVVGLQQQDWDEHRDSDVDMNNGTQPQTLATVNMTNNNLHENVRATKNQFLIKQKQASSNRSCVSATLGPLFLNMRINKLNQNTNNHKFP